MVEVSMTVPTSPDRVFAVLADGWSYVGWVVGASHIREVDAGWPGEGLGSTTASVLGRCWCTM